MLLLWLLPTSASFWTHDAKLLMPVLSCQVRLLEEDESYCSYGEAYEVNCARYGREPDIPIISFKRAICNERGDLTPDPHGQLRLQVRPSTMKSPTTSEVLQ